MPICLPSITDTSNAYAGMTATVAGWGLTEAGQTSEKQLLAVDVPIISNIGCKRFYPWLKRYICNLHFMDIHLNGLLLLQFSPLHSQAWVKQRSLRRGLRRSFVYQGERYAVCIDSTLSSRLQDITLNSLLLILDLYRLESLALVIF